jgi:N-formylglutamate deformylase
LAPYQIHQATAKRVPIIVSVPHCGIAFPDEIRDEYKPALASAPDDTDWFVEQLYDFAPALGITMITAVYSRWVIDLNRDPDSKPLYTDGRIITALCPTTTFLGEPLYKDERRQVTANEVTQRLVDYYYPYHMQVQNLLDETIQEFGRVLLWDCHAIRQHVPTIQPGKFPDLILGDADGRAAAPALIDTALKGLKSGSYALSHNHPFKGGTITRQFGKPEKNQHALQLEMSKVHYMDDSETRYDKSRANRMREVLKRTLSSLAEQLGS